jgi:GT2 family glycosyltransferase
VLTVCVPVLKRYDLLRKMLESLRDSTVMPDSVLIMNNGMDRARAEALVGVVPFTTIVNPNRPLGVAESWNWFIANTEEERVITNDDVEFAPMSLELMVARSEVFVSCTFGFSCFVIRDECVRRVGLFDEAISPGYGYFEDVDYLRRMKQAGVTDHVVQAGVVHHQSQTPAAYTRVEMQDHERRFLLARGNYAAKWGDTRRDAWAWGDIPEDTK